MKCKHGNGFPTIKNTILSRFQSLLRPLYAHVHCILHDVISLNLTIFVVCREFERSVQSVHVIVHPQRN